MLHKRSIKEKLFKGSAWAFSGKIVTVISALLVNGFLARLLTPEEMGAYFLTFSVVSVAAIFAQIGLNQTIVKFVAESIAVGDKGRAKNSIYRIFLLGLIGVLLTASILFFFGSWLSIELFNSLLMSSVMGLAAIWLIILSFQSLLAETFRGFHDIRLATIFGGLLTSVGSVLLFATLWFMQGYSELYKIILLSLVAGGSSTLIAVIILQRKITALKENSNEPKIKDIWIVAWPLWVTNLSLVMLTQLDLWILAIFRTGGEVAIYGASSQMMKLVVVPLMIVNAVVPPLIAEMHKDGNKERLERVLRTTATLAGIPAFLVLICFMLFGDLLLGIVFSDFYKEGAIVLMFLSVGQLVNVWAGSCGLCLMLTGHQITMMIITVASSFIALVAMFLLVDDFGAAGIAFAAAFSMIVQNILMLISTKIKIGIWTHVNLLSLLRVKFTQ